MNFDDRMGSCRDKGRMWGRVGAWCLSWWQREPVGTAWSKQSHPNQDKHQASSSTPPRPLSLPDPGPQAPQWIGLPDSVVNIHQGWTLLVVRRVEVFGGVLVLGRIAAAHMPAFETEAQVYPDPTSMWGRWPLDPHN